MTVLYLLFLSTNHNWTHSWAGCCNSLKHSFLSPATQLSGISITAFFVMCQNVKLFLPLELVIINYCHAIFIEDLRMCLLKLQLYHTMYICCWDVPIFISIDIQTKDHVSLYKRQDLMISFYSIITFSRKRWIVFEAVYFLSNINGPRGCWRINKKPISTYTIYKLELKDNWLIDIPLKDWQNRLKLEHKTISDLFPSDSSGIARRPVLQDTLFMDSLLEQVEERGASHIRYHMSKRELKGFYTGSYFVYRFSVLSLIWVGNGNL